jgi:anaerobic selenocysteine-containing dehydrogenase
MKRRTFLKLSAVGGAGSALAGCSNQAVQLIRFIPDETLIPGVATWKLGVCTQCSAGCGLQVRVMAGDAEVVRKGQSGIMRMGLAKKLAGNPDHPVNHGKLCVRGEAGLQVAYNPDRIRHPLKRAGQRGSGQFTQISWDEAMQELLTHVQPLSAPHATQSLAFLTRPLGGQRGVVVSRFLSGFDEARLVPFELFDDTVLRTANRLSFGYDQLPTFDLAHSSYVISFGADYLGTWNSPVAQNVAYGTLRQNRSGIRGKFVQVESRMSQTGANADEWVAAHPGTEGVLALAIAHVILKEHLGRAEAAGTAGTRIDGWREGLPEHSPDAIAWKTGVPPETITRLAREIAAPWWAARRWHIPTDCLRPSRSTLSTGFWAASESQADFSSHRECRRRTSDRLTKLLGQARPIRSARSRNRFSPASRDRSMRSFSSTRIRYSPRRRHGR